MLFNFLCQYLTAIIQLLHVKLNYYYCSNYYYMYYYYYYY